LKTIISYAGGKSKFRHILLPELRIFKGRHQYREPFFGGGSIGLDMISLSDSAWINDVEVGIACFWQCVAMYPRDLCKRVRDFVPNSKTFDDAKAFFLANPKSKTRRDKVEVAFRKLVLQRSSWSGLGEMSIGHWELRKSFWSPDHMCRRITEVHDMFTAAQVTITNEDFERSITDTSSKALLYLDPPYVGQQLYRHSFTNIDHERLCLLLKRTKHDWVLTYDDCDAVHALYDWATIVTVKANYSVAARGPRTLKTELLIFPPNHMPILTLDRQKKRRPD
jgi:DNA adenine methylase